MPTVMSYLDQTLGSAGQPSVWGARLMTAFYCSRRSRSSKLSFCSPQGARAAAVRARPALCFFYTRGEAGRAHCAWNGFTRGRRLADTFKLLLGPFVSAEWGACECLRTEQALSRSKLIKLNFGILKDIQGGNSCTAPARVSFFFFFFGIDLGK